jgi:hypothetical protein
MGITARREEYVMQVASVCFCLITAPYLLACGGSGGSNSSSASGGALDWHVLLVLGCLTLQRWYPARASAVRSRKWWL